jgi:ankyrin repeat protein/GTPase SAR1 family protein
MSMINAAKKNFKAASAGVAAMSPTSKKAPTAMLFTAAKENDVEAVRVVLQKTNGVALVKDIDEPDVKGLTPLMCAAANGNHEICSMLMKAGADMHLIEPKRGDTALLLAVRSNHIQVVNALVSEKVNLEQKNFKGATPLMLAGSVGNKTMTTYLINLTADLESKDVKGWTSVMHASYRGHTHIVKVLLEKKAVIDHVNKDGLTALYLACVGGHDTVVSLLLEHGANPDQAEKNFGVTPLIAAAKNGHDLTVRVLVKHGCDFDRKDEQGWTAIMHASHESHTKVVAELARPGSSEVVELQKDPPPAAKDFSRSASLPPPELDKLAEGLGLGAGADMDSLLKEVQRLREQAATTSKAEPEAAEVPKETEVQKVGRASASVPPAKRSASKPAPLGSKGLDVMKTPTKIRPIKEEVEEDNAGSRCRPMPMSGSGAPERRSGGGGGSSSGGGGSSSSSSSGGSSSSSDSNPFGKGAPSASRPPTSSSMSKRGTSTASAAPTSSSSQPPLIGRGAGGHKKASQQPEASKAPQKPGADPEEHMQGLLNNFMKKEEKKQERYTPSVPSSPSVLDTMLHDSVKKEQKKKADKEEARRQEQGRRDQEDEKRNSTDRNQGAKTSKGNPFEAANGGGGTSSSKNPFDISQRDSSRVSSSSSRTDVSHFYGLDDPDDSSTMNSKKRDEGRDTYGEKPARTMEYGGAGGSSTLSAVPGGVRTGGDFNGQNAYKIVLIGNAGVGKTNLLRVAMEQGYSDDYPPTLDPDFVTMTIPHPHGAASGLSAYVWDTAGQERYHAITRSQYRRADGAVIVFDTSSQVHITSFWRAFSFRCTRRMLTLRPFLPPLLSPPFSLSCSQKSIDAIPKWLSMLDDAAGDTLLAKCLVENKLDLRPRKPEYLMQADVMLSAEDINDMGKFVRGGQVDRLCHEHNLRRYQTTAKHDSMVEQWGGQHIHDVFSSLITEIYHKKGEAMATNNWSETIQVGTEQAQCQSKCCG